MAQGKLLDFSAQFRTDNKGRNLYQSGNNYQAGHTRALSDDETPEWGKGEVDGRVGGQTDINTRETLKSKNDYHSNNQYGVSE
jgi:hypothetical protein